MEKVVQYTMLSKLTKEELTDVTYLNVVLDTTKPKETSICLLKSCNGGEFFERFERYDSLTEFATTATKELLLLYVKRSIVEHDPKYFSKDDPRLHAFLSKLSYSNIKLICSDISKFAEQFKNKKITLITASNKRSNKKKF